MHNRDDGVWEWSVFWHSNQLHSCMPVDQDPDALGAQWRDFFSGLAPGAAILDMGTGNGSLAVQAVSVSRGKSPPFSIHGVDLADIEPSRFVAGADVLLSEVTFHPRTAMEKLPFAAQSFDAVGSQYAIEYSIVEKSIEEVERVLKPGGKVRLLLHADSGVLKARCERQYQQAQTILASDLFPASIALLKALVAAEAHNTAQSITLAQQLIARVKNVFDELEQVFSAEPDRSLIDNLFMAVRSLPGLRKLHNLNTLITMSTDIQSLLLAQSKRLYAMQQAALDDIEVNNMAAQLRLLKLEEVSLKPAYSTHGRAIIGYWLCAEKPAAMGEYL
jgi:SAM-dependent methyltransferase